MKRTPSDDAIAEPKFRFRAWLQAARPAAHGLIFLPLLLGQVLALRAGSFRFDLFVPIHVFGVLYQLYLLFLNDRGDQALDRSNQQYWLSGGSRVLPEGKLTSDDLLRGASLAFLAMALLTSYVALAHDRPGLWGALLLAVALSWAYDLPPLRLSYAGYGEVLQGLGCGILLPLVGYYGQHGSLEAFPWAVLIPLYLIFHTGNIVTALPDFPSDQQGHKRTYPVRHGQRRARQVVLVLLALATVSVLVVSPPLPLMWLLAIILPALFVLAFVQWSGLLRTADASNFAQCKRFVNWTSASQAWLLCAWTAALWSGRMA